MPRLQLNFWKFQFEVYLGGSTEEEPETLTKVEDKPAESEAKSEAQWALNTHADTQPYGGIYTDSGQVDILGAQPYPDDRFGFRGRRK